MIVSSRVVALVLTWNHLERTRRCLESLISQDYPVADLYIVVVDNASTDDTVAVVRNDYPQVELVLNSLNLGYAAGNNVGLQYALKTYNPDFLFVVNNDVVLARTALANLVAAAERHRDAGFLGPKIYQSDQLNVLQSAGTTVGQWGDSYQRGLDELDVGQFDTECEVDSLVGCTILIRAKAIEKIGLIDERFYLYHEDIDWCLRTRQNGFKLIYVPTSHVWHRSSNDRGVDFVLMQYYMTRNSFLLLWKNGFGVLAILRQLMQYLIWAANWTFNPKWRHKRGQRDAILKAIWDVLWGRYGRQAHCFGRKNS